MHFDLVIVGGGIVGATTAFLANRCKPEWRTLLVDRSFIGDGASRYSAGLDLPLARSPKQRAMITCSARFYESLATQYPNLPVRKIPFAVAAASRDKLSGSASFVDADMGKASPAQWHALREIYPGLILPEERLLIASRHGRCFATRELVSALVRKTCESANVACWEGAEVVSVDDESSGFAVLFSDGRKILSERLIVATGPWMTTGLGDPFSKSLGVQIKKVVALHIEVPLPAAAPVIYFAEDDAFFLPVPEQKKIILSFTSNEWDCSPEISRLRITRQDRDTAVSILKRYYPSFVERCHGGRVFCDAYTPDRAPLVCRIPSAHSLVIAGGCSGAGVRLAPAVAIEALQTLSPAQKEAFTYEQSFGICAAAHSER
jgi:glycine/D-amino acid oxidase-like deaminating enzyme